MKKIRRLAKKYNFKGPLTYTTRQDIYDALKSAKLEYSEFKPKAHELRETYLFNIANEVADDDPKGRSVEYHHTKLIREENTRNHFPNLRSCFPDVQRILEVFKSQ